MQSQKLQVTWQSCIDTTSKSNRTCWLSPIVLDYRTKFCKASCSCSVSIFESSNIFLAPYQFHDKTKFSFSLFNQSFKAGWDRIMCQVCLKPLSIFVTEMTRSICSNPFSLKDWMNDLKLSHSYRRPEMSLLGKQQEATKWSFADNTLAKRQDGICTLTQNLQIPGHFPLQMGLSSPKWKKRRRKSGDGSVGIA